MSAILALAIVLSGGAPTTSYTLACTQKVEGDGASRAFHLSFSVDGSKVARIAVDDPAKVLDPFGNIPVYEAFGDGRMTKSQPPKPKLKFDGKLDGNGFAFKSADRTLSITLALELQRGGTYAYSFTGWRMMDSTMRADLAGEGSCHPVDGTTT